MFFWILTYLICFTYGAYILLGKDIFAPSVIFGLTLIIGTFAACIGNVNWGVHIPVDVLIIYSIGTAFLLIGELLLKKNISKVGIKASYTQSFEMMEIRIPKSIIVIALIFSIVVVYYSKIKAIQIAYSNGYYGYDWQSMPVYVKHAVSSGRASYGMVLSTCRQIVEDFCYLGLFFFLMNSSVRGFLYSIKHHWNLLIFIIPYAYMMSLQGQRSSFVGIVAFGFYLFWILNYHCKISIDKNKIILTGLIFIMIFLIYFTIIGNVTGRAANSNSIENILVYTGSSIVDFSEYLNSPLNKYTHTWGTRTFGGMWSTIRRIFPFLKPINRAPVSYGFGFVYFKNGSASNVYGPFANFFSEFSYFGVALFPFLEGMIYRLMYNNAKKEGTSMWNIYLFSYIAYGIVIAFIDEQQFQLLFSVYQLMHLTIAYIILNICIKNYGKVSNRLIAKNSS